MFRPDPTLLLLFTRLQWEPNGEPHVPGNIQAWKNILKMKANSDIAHNWNVETKAWKNSDGLLETVIALSRVDLEGGPTDAFLVLTEVDGKRACGAPLERADSGADGREVCRVSQPVFDVCRISGVKRCLHHGFFDDGHGRRKNSGPHVARERDGHLRSQYRAVANPGSPRPDPRERAGQLLARHD